MSKKEYIKPNRKYDDKMIEMLYQLIPDFINKDDIKKIYEKHFDQIWESQWFGLEYDVSNKDKIISPSFFFFYNYFDLPIEDKTVDKFKNIFGPYLKDLTGIELEYDSAKSKNYDGIFVRLKDNNSPISKTNFIRNFAKLIPNFNIQNINNSISTLNKFNNSFWLGNLFGRKDPYLRILLLNNVIDDIPKILREINWKGNISKIMEKIKPMKEINNLCYLNGIQFSLKDETDKYVGIEITSRKKALLLGYLIHMELVDKDKIINMMEMHPQSLHRLSHVKIMFDEDGFKNTKIYCAYPNPHNITEEGLEIMENEIQEG